MEIIFVDYVIYFVRSVYNSVNWFFFEGNNVFRDIGFINIGMVFSIYVIIKSY